MSEKRRRFDPFPFTWRGVGLMVATLVVFALAIELLRDRYNAHSTAYRVGLAVTALAELGVVGTVLVRAIRRRRRHQRETEARPGGVDGSTLSPPNASPRQRLVGAALVAMGLALGGIGAAVGDAGDDGFGRHVASLLIVSCGVGVAVEGMRRLWPSLFR